MMKKFDGVRKQCVDMLKVCDIDCSVTGENSCGDLTLDSQADQVAKLFFLEHLNLSSNSKRLSEIAAVDLQVKDELKLQDLEKHWTLRSDKFEDSGLWNDSVTASDHWCQRPSVETVNETSYAVSCIDITPDTSSCNSPEDRSCFSEVPLRNCSDTLSISDDISCSSAVIDLNGRDSANRQKNADLFSVDLCSLVGQRYLQSSTCSYLNRSLLPPYDTYCQAPIRGEGQWLRARTEPYPVTFNKADLESYAHVYKFTRAEQIEFAERIGHWLDRPSRRLLKKMKPCVVQLTRLSTACLAKYMNKQHLVVRLKPLSKSTLKKWTNKKKTPKSTKKVSYSPVERCNTVSRVLRVDLSSCGFSLRHDFPFKTLGDYSLKPTYSTRIPLSSLNEGNEANSCHSSTVHFAPRNDAVFSSQSHRSTKSNSRAVKQRNLSLKVSANTTRVHSPAKTSYYKSLLKNKKLRRNKFGTVASFGTKLSVMNCSVMLKDFRSTKRRCGYNIPIRKVPLHTKMGKCFVNLTDCSKKVSLLSKQVTKRNVVPGESMQAFAKENRSLVMPRKICAGGLKSVCSKTTGLVGSHSAKRNGKQVLIKRLR